MPHDYDRTDRIGEQIKRELATLIRDEIKDPRVGRLVTILDVRVTRDLSQAKVFFDVMDQDSHAACEKGLNSAAGFLRHELGHRIKLRNTPALQFIYDDTELRANELSARIDAAIASDHEPPA